MVQKLPTDFGYWYLITIDDYPKMLGGKSFFDMLQLIQQVEQIKYVILDRIQGWGYDYLIYSLQKTKDKVYDIEKVLRVTKRITQLDWGDFFLFKEYPRSWKNPNDEPYPYVISQANTTLRAVDDQYMYVYTQSKHLVDALSTAYEIESYKRDALDKLDFPY